MPMTRSFDLPEELALKLESFAKSQGKRVEALLADIVSEYIEVTEFILRKGKAGSPKRRQSKGGRT